MLRNTLIDPSKLMEIKQVSQALDVSDAMTRYLVRNGQLPVAFRCASGKPFFHADVVAALKLARMHVHDQQEVA